MSEKINWKDSSVDLGGGVTMVRDPRDGSIRSLKVNPSLREQVGISKNPVLGAETISAVKPEASRDSVDLLTLNRKTKIDIVGKAVTGEIDANGDTFTQPNATGGTGKFKVTVPINDGLSGRVDLSIKDGTVSPAPAVKLRQNLGKNGGIEATFNKDATLTSAGFDAAIGTVEPGKVTTTVNGSISGLNKKQQTFVLGVGVADSNGFGAAAEVAVTGNEVKGVVGFKLSR